MASTPSPGPDDFVVALSNCEREPIHVPGLVQTFGAAFAIDVDSETLTHHSLNLAEVLGVEVGARTTLQDLLGERGAHDLRNVAGLDTLATQRERLGSMKIAGRWQDVSAYRSGARLVVECEPARGGTARSGSLLSRARQMLGTTRGGDSVQTLLDQAVACVRDSTGYDRVMAYRFLENGEGEVAAEAVGVGVDSFLGLRYPAYDIPPQVRKIALISPLRLIVDVAAEPVGLVAVHDAEPLDMSLGQLRGVSPVHLEYLANMGVRATLVLSLVVRGELWGLIACHHLRPLRVSPDDRALCELYSQFLSLELQQRIELERLRSRQRAGSVRESLLAKAGNSEDLLSVFDALTEVLPTLVAHDGLALVERGHVRASGNTLPEPQLRELIALADTSLDIVPFESLIAIADRGDAWRRAIDASTPLIGGALVLRFAADSDAWLVLFRNEILTEVRWGGEPDKTLTYGPNGPRLHPRGSFDEYRQSVRGRCAPWSADDEAVLTQFRLLLLETVMQLRMQSDVERERQRRHGDLLIAELNHRVKNILALVQSVTRQTQDDSQSVEEYANALEQRIAALASAHEVVGANGLQWAELEPMLLRDLRPFGYTDSDRVRIDGRPCFLRGDIAPIVSLVFHEMATNSAKHGALSVPAGRVGVYWSAESGGLSIAWRESGGPAPAGTPTRSGFGRSLIEGAIAYECGGESRMRFLPTGLEIDIWLPASSVSFRPDADADAAGDVAVAATGTDDETPSNAPSHSAPDARDAVDGGGDAGDPGALGRVLVIEDNLLIVNDVRRILGELGCHAVDAAPTVARALELIATVPYDLAVVDINLREESSFEAATALRERGVRIVFCTGYDVASALPDAFAGTPILGKPLTLDALTRVLAVTTDPSTHEPA